MSTISLNLDKGISLNLSKEFEGIKNIDVGLGWKTHMDLDAFAIMLDANDNLLGVTYYGDKNMFGVRLSGDDLVGGKNGDCEVIYIKTESLSSEVKKICLFANIYKAGHHTFNDVENSYIRLINSDTKEELAKYNLKDDIRNYNAIHFADLEVNNDDLVFTTIGKGLNGSIADIKNLYLNKNFDSGSNTSTNKKSFWDRLFGR